MSNRPSSSSFIFKSSFLCSHRPRNTDKQTNTARSATTSQIIPKDFEHHSTTTTTTTTRNQISKLLPLVTRVPSFSPRTYFCTNKRKRPQSKNSPKKALTTTTKHL